MFVNERNIPTMFSTLGPYLLRNLKVTPAKIV